MKQLKGPAILVALVAAAAASLLAGCGALVAEAEPTSEPAEAAPTYAAPPGERTVRPRESSGTVEVDPGWARRVGAAAGIPEVAMRAYGRAQLLLADEQPDCGVSWTTLAGLGYVESLHGTIDGRSLEADGRSSSRILGPALDGEGDVAAIPATESSEEWHGDPEWDHAVGPLQFIPSTWSTWASDGDGDGRRDPNDLDDAAYAAARYLCADGNDLTAGDGWGAAVFSYNHAEEYVDAVYAAASAYATRAG